MRTLEVDGLLDDAHRVRLASLSLTMSLRTANTTAVQIHNQWLSLATTYFTPEADIVLRGMDRPSSRAAELLDVATLAESALLQYADQLSGLARWPTTTSAEVLAVHQARSAAEWSCAAALQAIPRPGLEWLDTAPSPHRRAGERAHGQRLAGQDIGDTPHLWSFLTPGGPPGAQWRHPEESSATRFINQWAGLAPPDTEDLASHTLYAFSMLGFGSATTADWMITVEHGTFRPRASTGRYVSLASLTTAQRFVAGAGSVSQKHGLTTPQRLRTFTPAGTFEAKGHRGPAHRQWTATASRWGRTNTAVTVTSSGWAAWQDNAGYATDKRIGRTATQGVAVSGGAIAGGQAGALLGSAIGTAIAPGAGTLVGATVGGLVGGFAGSELGGWVGDHVVDVGGEAGDLIGDSLAWVGGHSEAGADVVDTVTFWD